MARPDGFEDTEWFKDPRRALEQHDQDMRTMLTLEEERRNAAVGVTQAQLAEAILELLDE